MEDRAQRKSQVSVGNVSLTQVMPRGIKYKDRKTLNFSKRTLKTSPLFNKEEALE
jgi:hypothetical protein